jgi:hypothetical protein
MCDATFCRSTHSFILFISQIGIETSTFYIQYNFAWALHGGVDVVKWSGCLLVL